MNKNENKFNKEILFVILYFFIFISFYTAFLIKTTKFINAVKVGRFVIFSLGLYFILINLIRDKKQLKNLWLFFRVSIWGIFIIQIISDIIGEPFLLDLKGIHYSVQYVGPFTFLRIYWPIYPILYIFYMGIYNLYTKKITIFKVTLFELIISIILIIHLFSRSFWFSNLLGFLLYIALLNKKYIISHFKGKIKKSFFVVILNVVVIYSVSFFIPGFNNFLSARIDDAIEDLIGEKAGTFTGRYLIANRLYYVSKSRTIFQLMGMGFVHSSSKFSIINGGGKDLESYEGFHPLNADFGWPSMFFTYGILGVVILVYFYLHWLNILYKVANFFLQNEYKAFITMGFVIIFLDVFIRAWVSQTILSYQISFFLASIIILQKVESKENNKQKFKI